MAAKAKMKTGGMANPNPPAKAAPSKGSKSVPYKKGGAVKKKK